MATVTTLRPGNLAIQTEVWTLTRAEAKRALSNLRATKGSYWDAHLARPYRRACRAHAETVTVYTAGFSSGELSNALHA